MTTAPPDGTTAKNTRLWVPDWPVPVDQVLSQQRRGATDPTYKVDFQGRHWRGIRTPEGEATLMVDTRPKEGRIYGAAWAPGRTGRWSPFRPCWGRRTTRAGSSPATRCWPTSGATTATGGSAAPGW